MKRSIEEMAATKADEVVLEAEVTNKGALALYRNLGFLRDKRLLRFVPLTPCFCNASRLKSDVFRRHERPYCGIKKDTLPYW